MTDDTKSIIERIKKEIEEKGESKLSPVDEIELLKKGIKFQSLCQDEGWVFEPDPKTLSKTILKLPDNMEYEKNPKPSCLPLIVQKPKEIPIDKSIFEGLREVPEDSLEAKLYQIIDDIDTGFDIFKPEINPFENYVGKKIHEKDKLIISDGYKLYYAGSKKEERLIEKEKNIEKLESFQSSLTDLINKYSVENGSDTPDFILAEYLCDCLLAYEKAIETNKKRSNS